MILETIEEPKVLLFYRPQLGNIQSFELALLIEILEESRKGVTVEMFDYIKNEWHIFRHFIIVFEKDYNEAKKQLKENEKQDFMFREINTEKGSYVFSCKWNKWILYSYEPKNSIR